MTPVDPDFLPNCLHSLPPYLRERCRHLGKKEIAYDGLYVLYWTHHALRTDENPALDASILMASQLGKPLVVYQGISEDYPFASDRHHMFMLEGARDLQAAYAQLRIPYFFFLQRRTDRRTRLLEIGANASLIVTEDFPLEPTIGWTELLADRCQAPLLLVDTACVLPSRLVGKAYDRAYQYREATSEMYRDRVARSWPDIHGIGRSTKLDASTYEAQIKKLSQFFDWPKFDLQSERLEHLISQCDIDHAVGPISDTPGGSKAGYQRWQSFLRHHLSKYASTRNSAEHDGTSRMSAYLHYGMVAPTRLARDVQSFGNHPSGEKFLDELLVWRELGYAFCHYRDDYETLHALPAWAKTTLEHHRHDPRPASLSWETCARGRTGDEIWDLAQLSLLRHGELHNNLRMTWGKAILEWSKTPELALQRLIDLNHRYALDGRDPASYAGILWCLGQFDRPFHPEHPITGTIRPRRTADHATRFNRSTFIQKLDRRTSSSGKSIAMIGAGLGGLFCSRILSDHGFQVQVFEKSKGFGGRAATRHYESALQFDHGAQYFTVRDHRIGKYLQSWLDDGVVAPWTGKIVEIHPGRIGEERRPLDRFVGFPKMNSLGKHLGKDLNVELATRIVQVQAAERKEGSYEVIDSEGGSHGPFDSVLFNLPPKQLMAVAPSDCPWRKDIENCPLTPCWTGMIAFSERWNLPFDGAFCNQGPLRWIGRETSKPGRPQELDCWVLHSTDSWSAQNLDLSPSDVIEQLLEALKHLQLATVPEPLFRNATRWLFATPTAPLDQGALWDSDFRMGACGDWCHGARVEGALLSGMALAGKVLGSRHRWESALLEQGNTSIRQLDLF